MKDKKIQSKKFFDSRAKNYDKSFLWNNPRECHKIVINELSKINYNKLLDVGCGTGLMLNKIRTNNGKLYGIDISNKMIDIAMQKENNNKIDYKVSDAENIPFENEQMDVITCVESFHHYPNPEKVIIEFKRVLKSNGILIICDMYRKNPIRFFYKFFMKIVNTGDVTIYTKSEMCTLCEKNGFEVIKSYISTPKTFLIIARKVL